jgi:hypothetical protein
MTVAHCLAVSVGVALAALAVTEAAARPVVVNRVDRYRYCDPNFECVRIVLARRGEKFTPEYIQGISGMAFRIGGPCPCAPTCSLAMNPEELVELLGYECQQFPLFGKGADPRKKVHELVKRVRAEIRAARPVVVWHAFTAAEWDVVVGYDAEARQFLGRGTYAGNGKKLARADETRTATCGAICPELGAIFIGRKVREPDARQAELAALAEAVRHARSPRDRFLETLAHKPLPWRFREGIACYDAWAQSFRCDLRRLPSGPGDRYPIGVYADTRKAASGFLRQIAPKYPKLRQRLLSAAGHFDADAEALVQARDLIGPGWKLPKKPDPKRNLRTAELLTLARTHYARGIDELAAALEQIDPKRAKQARCPARFRRKGSEVRIWDFSTKYSWRLDRRCTFLAALSDATKFSPHPYVYHDLMGLTALAFRVRWCNDETKTKWCPSCAIGEMPDEQALAARQTGWSLPTEWLPATKRDNNKFRKRIVASIDAGKPVVAYPPIWNMALIYGYDDGGKTLLINSYDADDFPLRLPAQKLGPLVTFLGEYGKPPSMAAAMRRALQTAVRNWKRTKHHGGLEDRGYWYGRAAFEAWIRDLRNYEKLPAKSQKGLRGIDTWNYLALFDARQTAEKFLKDWAVVMPDKAQPHLAKAAACYKKECELLKPLAEERNRPDSKGDYSRKARAREIQALTEAAKLEAQAIAAIEKALKP